MKYRIGKKWVGPGEKTFIVAEISANHNQQYSVAIDTIHAIKKSGADAVKLQTYTPDTITIDAKTKYFQIRQKTLWDGQTLYGLYKTAYTPWEWHEGLKKETEKLGMAFFSSPFDASSVDFLAKLSVPVIKIASFEITDIPLISYAARLKKPMIISTGIAGEAEIREAIAACHKVGNKQIILLKCVSSYPARIEDMNIRTMVDMRDRFKTLVGLSDHSFGSTAPVVAASLGAVLIEKHFILDKKIGGPDCEFSLDPTEFKQMVDDVRRAESSLGSVTYELSASAQRNKAFSRSIFVIRDIKAGEKFSEDNIRSIRPGFGLHPRYLPKIMGLRCQKSIKRGIPLSWAHFSLSDSKRLQKKPQ